LQQAAELAMQLRAPESPWEGLWPAEGAGRWMALVG